MTLVMFLLFLGCLALLLAPVVVGLVTAFQMSRVDARLRRREFELRRKAHQAKTEIRRIVRERMRQMNDS